MIIADLVRVATTEFEAKMFEFGQNLDTRRLTADLAEKISHALEDALSAAGRSACKAFLESYDFQEPTLEVNGRTLRLKTISPKTFLTRFGLIEILRGLYQADQGGPAYVPLDHLWDMDGHFATVDVREAVCFAMAHMTAQETAQLFEKCSAFRPSATAIKHIVEKVSDDIRPHQERIETRIQEHIEVPDQTRVFVASMDGANVLLREQGTPRGRPPERPGKEADKDKHSTYKNAMVATLSLYGEVPEDQTSPQRLASVAMARMPEEKALTLKEKFEHQLDVLEPKIGPHVIKIFLSDGHRSLWNYVYPNERFDDYEKLIDFYHTEEHLSKAAAALFGKHSTKAKAWYNRCRVTLLEQDDAASLVLRSMNYYCQTQRLSKTRREDLAKEQTFFRRNKHRMDYADFRTRGLPIGSGPVEAACKSIVKTRLCRSGMRWSRQGGQRILDLRCYAKSGLWDPFWEAYKYYQRSA